MRCPTCEESFDPEKSDALPFCGARCRDIDLGRWIDERHSIPVERQWDEDDIGEVMN